MVNKIFKVECPVCHKDRMVSKQMLSLIKASKYSGRCKSCSLIGNKYRFTGKEYDTKKYYNSPTYQSWYNMKTRCTNKNNKFYEYYGGRGIKICERWMDFKNFLDDMGDKPVKLTLDRIDNDGNYEPRNCRWATKKEQANNTRNIEKAQKITFDGVTRTITEWSRKLGINRTTLGMRIQRYNWDIERALFT